jgi:ankyrin repeat protein
VFDPLPSLAFDDPIPTAAFAAEFLNRGLSGVDVEDKDGATPLYYACSKGHDETAKLLLDRSVCGALS